MQDNNSLNANFILKKLKYLLDISTDVQLAKILDIRPNTLSTWKQRNSVDYKLIIKAARNRNLDLKEIFYDEKSTKCINYPTNYTPIIAKENIQQYINGDLEENFSSLPYYNFILGNSSKSIAFQVSTNRLAPLIPEESFAVCNLSSFHEINEEKYYVLISKKFGFFISRIKKIDKVGLELIDIQTTGKMKNYTLKKSSISEIWEVIGVSIYKSLLN